MPLTDPWVGNVEEVALEGERILTFDIAEDGYRFMPGSIVWPEKAVPVTLGFDRRRAVGRANLTVDEDSVLADIRISKDALDDLSSVWWSCSFVLDDFRAAEDRFGDVRSVTEVKSARILEVTGLLKPRAH